MLFIYNLIQTAHLYNIHLSLYIPSPYREPYMHILRFGEKPPATGRESLFINPTVTTGSGAGGAGGSVDDFPTGMYDMRVCRSCIHTLSHNIYVLYICI